MEFFPMLQKHVDIQASVREIDVKHQIKVWTDEKVDMPKWTAAYYIKRLSFPRICLRMNHRKGMGCSRKSCPYEHRCLFCGEKADPEHGMFYVDNATGRYQCAEFSIYLEQRKVFENFNLDRYTVNELVAIQREKNGG